MPYRFAIRSSVPQVDVPSEANVVSAPEAFEGSSAQLRVRGGVLDVGVAEPKLQPSGIMAGIGQEMPACMAQHVRMRVRQSRSIAGALDHLGDVRARHGATTFAGEHKG